MNRFCRLCFHWATIWSLKSENWPGGLIYQPPDGKKAWDSASLARGGDLVTFSVSVIRCLILYDVWAHVLTSSLYTATTGQHSKPRWQGVSQTSRALEIYYWSGCQNQGHARTYVCGLERSQNESDPSCPRNVGDDDMSLHNFLTLKYSATTLHYFADPLQFVIGGGYGRSFNFPSAFKLVYRFDT